MNSLQIRYFSGEGYPSLSIIIPTAGRESLFKTIESINCQEFLIGDMVIIVGDGSQPKVENFMKDLGYPFIYYEYIKTNDWGNSQRNAGLQKAKSDYIIWMDDDDVFPENAFNIIRSAIRENPGLPHIFRFLTSWGTILWQEKKIVQGQIGGHEFVTPNIPEKLGKWGLRYEGDYDFIVSTLKLWPSNSLIWREEIIAICRP